MSFNKEIAKKSQSILNDLGYKVSLGHAYEFLSQLSGFNSWNAANSKKVNFTAVVADIVTVETPNSLNLNRYDIKLKLGDENDIELRKFYRINARSEEEARAIIQEYVHVREGEISENKVKHDQTRDLLQLEDEYQFRHMNWEVVSTNGNPKIEEIYSLD
jgi:hypothetical protein